MNDQDKNYFSMISLRKKGALKPKEHKRLLRKQFRKFIRNRERSVHLTFPIDYPCSKKCDSLPVHRPSLNSIKTANNPLKSAVSITFTDDEKNRSNRTNSEQSRNSSPFLRIPSSKNIRSLNSNAYSKVIRCRSCGFVTTNGACSCIVQCLLQLNDRKEDAFFRLNA